MPTPQPTHAAPPCRAEDLRLVGADSQGANQQVFMYVTLRARKTCDVAGRPRGCSSPPRADCARCARNVLRSCVGSWDRPATCTAGQKVLLALTYFVACEQTPLRTIAHRPPRGGGSLALRRSVVVGCGLSAAPFGVPADLPRQPPPDPLDVGIHAPAVLHPGSLNYSVTLRNHTGRAVRLHPCPGYTESAGSVEGPGHAPPGNDPTALLPQLRRCRRDPGAQCGYFPNDDPDPGGHESSPGRDRLAPRWPPRIVGR